jgi:hypothetical protein
MPMFGNCGNEVVCRRGGIRRDEQAGIRLPVG